MPQTGRLPALDGLRGVAALVVVAFHVLLLSPSFADRAQAGPGLRPGDPSWWVTHTPLYLLWAGQQAVFLFFVLSRFVLTLSALGRPVRWRAYYPRRLVRLYVPVWGSLLFAVVLAARIEAPLTTRVGEGDREVLYEIGNRLRSASATISVDTMCRVDLEAAAGELTVVPALVAA